MKRELGERGRRGESSSREEERKTRRRRRSEEEDDESSDYKVMRNFSLSRCSFKSPPSNNNSPESELLKPDELKNILFRFNADVSSNDIHWYHINTGTINASNNITTTAAATDAMVTNLRPICTIPESSRIGRGCASALLGSKLYMFGGSPCTIDYKQILKGCSDVFSIDFNAAKTEVVWRKERFRMLAKRCQPVAAATHGKIFIFGSNDCETLPKPWGEVFEPNLNLFSPLPEPPLYVKQAYGCIDITVVADGNTILLCMDDALFSFNVITGSWGQLSKSPLLIGGHWSFRSATLDDVLFTYSEGRVHAYDLIGEKWFKKPVLDLATMSNIPPFYLIHGHVVRIGNKTLCVVWLDELNLHPQRSVGCVNFQVVRETNSKGNFFLRAQVHSRSDYLIPTGYFFDDCLPL